MDYAKTASLVIKYVGGKDNIKSVAHCATRLRFQLKDNELRNEEAISDLEGVKGVFLTQSQFQIIFGSGTVNLVCAEVQKQLGNMEEGPEDKEAGEEKGNPIQRFIKMLSDIFVPIIPAIVAGGLLMGLNNLLTSPLFQGQAVIERFPQWQGLAAAVNAYQIGITDPPMWNIFGFQIAAIGYQGTVLPVLAVSWILANIEKRLRRITPSWLDNLTTPLLSILVTSFLTFIFVGPVLREAGNLLATGITWLYNTLGPVGGALFGFAYAPITMTGMHHSFIAIETQLLADSAHTGGSFIFSTASMNNVAQGAAVLAVLLMTKNQKIKSICSASGISALLGITEPAMFGVTLKLKYPFYAAMAGSAVGSAYLAGTRTLAQALGAAGLPGFISMKPDHYLDFAIGILLSMGVSFILTIVFWKKSGLEKQENTQGRKEVKAGTGIMGSAGSAGNAGTMESADTTTILYSPMKGEILPVDRSMDEVFASRALGDGIALNPEDGMVYAPCDGTISLLFPTKHAVGITSDTGIEVLIHIGINTVQLDGAGFEAYVAQGDKVKCGDKLILADLKLINEKGLNPQTMMILPEGGGLKAEVYPLAGADAGTMAMAVRR